MIQDGTRVCEILLPDFAALTCDLQSLSLGRPPTMSLSWIDCRIPEENETVDGICELKTDLAADMT